MKDDISFQHYLNQLEDEQKDMIAEYLQYRKDTNSFYARGTQYDYSPMIEQASAGSTKIIEQFEEWFGKAVADYLLKRAELRELEEKHAD